MEPRESDLEKLGKSLSEVLAHQGSEHEQIRQAREAFLQDFALRHAPQGATRLIHRAHGWWRYALAACLGTVAAAGLWFWPRAVSFQVGEARPGRLGDVVEALDGRPTPLQFSEGSRLLLHEGGRMRVLSLAPGAARVLVEDGILDVSVSHAESQKTRWDLEAGPYRITVTGTKFRMAFLSRDQRLSLTMQEGQVIVASDCQDDLQKVSAGESVDLVCPARQGLPSSEESEPSASAEEAAEEQAQTAPGGAHPAAAPLPPSAREELTWRGLLAAGRLSDGLAAAKRFGFQRACKLATAKELLGISDAARLYGSPVDAVAPLRILRQRFPGTTDAATAAFRLGLIAFELERNYALAAQWFESYLRDQPSGPLMGDSFGRLMQARSRAGDMPRARADAQQYLRKFPQGPYALEARGILSR